jgi:sialate O-acetylesterase
MQFRKSLAWFGFTVVTALAPIGAAPMPKADVVEVPAIGEGLCVHNLFQSNMVLQRDKPVNLWGWAAPGEQVSVTVAGNSGTATTGKDRLWKVTLPAMMANSEPISVTVKGKDKTLSLDNVLVGDVWILGGQSNMEFPLSKVENGNMEIVSANFPKIRILTIPAAAGPAAPKGFARLHEWSDWSNQHFRKGDWDICSPETVKDLSAIGYAFARRLHMASGVPIGVVDVSRGGTTVETWTPDAVIRKIDTEPVKSLLADWDQKVAAWDPKKDLEDQIQRHKQWVEKMTKDGKPIPADRKEPTELRPGPALDANRPGNCYAGMIGPIEGLAVKGAIFHQGFNNCFNGEEGTKMYRDVFPKMITAWRAAFNDPELPFGILSLCTADQKQSLENYSAMMADVGAMIREAQYQTFLEFHQAGDKHIGYTSTYDLRRRWYHPQLKLPAGERIARWALATEYGFAKQLAWLPPKVEEMKVVDGSIQLTMDVAVNGVDDGGPIEGFAIAGEDRQFHPAKAEHLITGKDQKNQKVLVLTSPMVPAPLHYRYAWARNPMGNLQVLGNTDIPFATQRSDTWPHGEMIINGELKKFEGRPLQAALRTLDQARKTKEAAGVIGGEKP